MRTIIATTVLAALAFGSVGCSFIKRSPEQYRDDTQALLEQNSGKLKACYDGILKTDKTAAGTVTVFFVVEKETGALKMTEVKADQSTAPQPVQDCVMQALEGLALDPGDADDGHATFSYEFEIAPQAAPPPAPAS